MDGTRGELDRPIRIKRMPVSPQNTDWRVRPEAASKSFRIEKRQGGQWTLVASFLVQLDPCKPPPSKAAEPPPEPETPPVPEPTAPAVRGKPPTLKRPKQ